VRILVFLVIDKIMGCKQKKKLSCFSHQNKTGNIIFIYDEAFYLELV